MTDFLARVDAILRERQAAYGPPEMQHALTAQLWSVVLAARMARYGQHTPLTAREVIWCNVLQKIAREICGAPTSDTPLDIAGFAENASRCA